MKNQKMIQLTGALASVLPLAFILATIANYVINAILVLFFLAPILTPTIGPNGAYWVAGAGAFTFQFFRAVIVGWGLLTPTDSGEVPVLVKFVAFTATVIATIELWFALGHADFSNSAAFWAVFVFSCTVIWGGYTTEIMFVQSAHKSVSDALGTPESDDDDNDDDLPALAPKRTVNRLRGLSGVPASTGTVKGRPLAKLPLFEELEREDSFSWDFPGTDSEENPKGKN